MGWKPFATISWIGPILGCCVLLASCVFYESERGIPDTWRQNQSRFHVGVTTQRDILDMLGPPSQVISLKDKTAYYYVLEKTKGQNIILVVFNNLDSKTTYDRAIFFFDEAGTLTDYGLSSPPAKTS